MTTTLRAADKRRAPATWRPWLVPLLAVLAVAIRLLMVGRPPGPDEAGFLMIGSQWHGAGASLYGNYWVDRPPLLITVFRLAAQLGGVVPLRLIGCLATVSVVVGSAHVARRIAGDRAAPWAALTAAALCVDPLLGTARVDGELLAAPFVVAGVAAAIEALHGRNRARIAGAAAVAGASMVAALLIKQNIGDVGIFVAVAGLLAWRRGHISTGHLVHLAAGFVAGAAAILSVVTVWMTVQGISPVALFEALYPFRLAAAHVLASANGSHAPIRAWALLGAWVLSGLAFLMVLITRATVTQRLRGTTAVALVSMLAFDVLSVLLGGNYWNHYLVQLVVPIAILSGVLVSRLDAGMRKVIVASAVIAVIGCVIALPFGRTSGGVEVGKAIAAASRPDDSIVTLYGHAEITESSGLSSPYPYLWSLPVKTLDPRLHALDAVLQGPRAPTWIVVSSHVSSWGLTTATTSRLITDRYHPVGHPFGRTVYLRDGADRPTLLLTGSPS